LGPESTSAAEASECAGDQDSFWEYHDALFVGKPDTSNEGLINIAEDLGLDVEAFSQCMESGTYAEIVQAQAAMARQIGVSSTPAFIINGQAVLGAQPFENFEQVIDSQLTVVE
jgi:protein-disulfide isomerase